MLLATVVLALCLAASCSGEEDNGDYDDDDCPLSASGLRAMPYTFDDCADSGFKLQISEFLGDRGDLADDSLYAVRGWLTSPIEQTDDGEIDRWRVALWLACGDELFACGEKLDAGEDQPFDVQLRVDSSDCHNPDPGQGLLLQVYAPDQEIGVDEPRLSCGLDIPN